MSDSKRESAAVAISPQLSGERLSELLSAISEAPDFEAAATFMLAQFADIVGARRALAVTLDSPPRRFISTASIGFEGNASPTVSLPTDDLSNPLAVSALSLHPVSCDGATPLPGIPFGEWTAIPFPQPQFRGPPPLLSEAELDLVQVKKGCQVRRRAPELRLWKRDRCPLAERDSGQRRCSVATHGVKRQRRNRERIRKIVRWKGDRWTGVSLESDAGTADETSGRAVQRHGQCAARADNVGERREHERRGSFKIGRFGDSGEELGQTLSAELRADGYRGALTLGVAHQSVRWRFRLRSWSGRHGKVISRLQ